MNLTATIANSLWSVSNVPALIRFRRALHQPAETQRQLLRDYLAKNAGCAYGKMHGFSEIKNYEEFAHRVPLNSYDDLKPWIERIMRGENQMLTAEPVTHLIPTSGSSGSCKLIPFTAGLQREFSNAIGPWVTALYSHHPAISLGAAYWSISPALQIQNVEPSAVPIGFEDDSSYLGGTKKRLVNAVMAVPSELRLISNMEQFRYLTLLCLLRQPDLRLISIWHPSFLTLLLDALPADWGNLLDDIQSGHCRFASLLPPMVLQALALRPMPHRTIELKKANPENPETIWPQLKVISCWGDAHAGYGVAELQRRFPHVLIQPKGLIATEAIVTIPFFGIRPLAVCSHFFEFVDSRGLIHLAHELQKNEIYEVVVTTGAGLWRYRLKDQVQVTDFINNTPSLQFVGRSQNISDRYGEKLSEAFVAQCIQETMTDLAIQPRFVLLAPDEDYLGCRYTLYVEGEIHPDIAPRLETILCKNLQYDWCRKLGQLNPVSVFQIKSDGYDVFAGRELLQGKRLGEIKPCSISTQTGWSQFFSGNYLISDDMPSYCKRTDGVSQKTFQDAAGIPTGIAFDISQQIKLRHTK